MGVAIVFALHVNVLLTVSSKGLFFCHKNLTVTATVLLPSCLLQFIYSSFAHNQSRKQQLNTTISYTLYSFHHFIYHYYIHIRYYYVHAIPHTSMMQIVHRSSVYIGQTTTSYIAHHSLPPLLQSLIAAFLSFLAP